MKYPPTPKQLFLIDGLGALLTAIMLGLVLANFVPLFGMPKSILYPLSLIACVFAVYSLSCHFRFPANWQPYLKAIAAANLLYCCLTLGLVLLMVYSFQKLTMLGVIYFLVEIVIVVGLAVVELRVASANVESSRG